MFLKYKGLLCVFGGFLIHFSLGTIYTFGNISPYIASYLKLMSKSQDSSNGDMVWIFACAFAFQGLTMTFGGLLNKKIGPKLTTLIGCWTMSISVMLTYFTIKINLYFTIITYGALFGAGIGIAYSVAIGSAIKWFPDRRGLVIGIVVGGFGLGSLVFNQVQTLFINPYNESPNITIGTDKYFGDKEMLERVPFCFLLIGGIYAVLQFIGCMIQFTPSIFDIKGEIIVIQELQKDSSLNICIEEIVDKEVIEVESNNQIQENVTSLKALRKRDFWILWLTLMFAGIVNVFSTTLYKTFGQLFINDDLFLAIVGSVASFFNASGRIFWGQIMDKFSYKVAMRCITIITAIFIGTFFCCKLVLHEKGMKIMLTVWVCTLLANICGVFSILPAACSKAFGVKNVATIYGMLFSANAIASIIGALSTSILLSKIGYLGIFEMGAGLCVIAFLLTFAHSRSDL